MGLLFLSGCTKQDSDKSAAPSAPQTPDSGFLPGVKFVVVETSGQGYTREEGVEDALAMAVAQVNGRTFSDGKPGKIRGAVKDFTVLSERQVERKIPERKNVVDVRYRENSSGSHSTSGAAAGHVSGGRDGGSYSASGAYSAEGRVEQEASLSTTSSATGTERIWDVKIRANVIKYDGGAGSERPRIVVALPRTSVAGFELGDSRLPAAEIADRIRRSLVDQLSRSNRFLVIDRGFSAEIDAELQNITAPSANPADVVRLGQRLTADIVMVPVIEYFEYRRNVRTLKLSGRELVSYAGGFKGTVSVLNVASGRLITNDTFSVPFPKTEPRALGSGVDAQGIADSVVRDWTVQQVGTLIRKTFPVSVIKLNGNEVVLSQGGSLLRQGVAYELVQMGDELIDPQTRQSLGRTEEPIGTVTVTRVDPNLSYGRILLSKPLAAAKFRPGLLEVRGEISASEVGFRPGDSGRSGPALGNAVPEAERQQKQNKSDTDQFLDE